MPALILTAPARTSLPRQSASLRARLATALELWHQRRALALIDDARLADLGLTRAQARAESSRPFWDAPLHWR
jgi:uncharacterized protein YjiS (DUF1127 family)